MVDDLFDIGGQAGGTSGDQVDSVPDLFLRLHVHPGAGRTAVVGRHGHALKVKVSAPPTDGRANAACVVLVAETLDIPSAQVELSGGASSRSKRVRVSGVPAEDMRRALELALGNAAGPAGVPPQTY